MNDVWVVTVECDSHSSIDSAWKNEQCAKKRHEELKSSRQSYELPYERYYIVHCRVREKYE